MAKGKYDSVMTFLANEYKPNRSREIRRNGRPSNGDIFATNFDRRIAEDQQQEYYKLIGKRFIG